MNTLCFLSHIFHTHKQPAAYKRADVLVLCPVVFDLGGNSLSSAFCRRLPSFKMGSPNQVHSISGDYPKQEEMHILRRRQVLPTLQGVETEIGRKKKKQHFVA